MELSLYCLVCLGETELRDDYDSYKNTLWLDMSWFSRFLHVLKQVNKNRLINV